MRTLAAVRLAVAVLAMLALARPAGAQLAIGGLNVEGEVFAGYRFYLVEPSDSRKGKFEEYRSLPESPFLEGARIRLHRPDESYSTEFGGVNWGQEDQLFFLGAERLGLWQFGFEWDQISHIYTTTARTRANEVARGNWVLPAPRPNLSTYNSETDDWEISQRWDIARLFFSLTPTPDLDLRAEYTRIHKHGDRPFGMAFGSPGSNFFEIVAPIEHTVQEVRLRATYARDTWQLQGGYTLSLFNNAERGVFIDNPCLGLAGGTLTGGCAGDAAGPTRGFASLEPDNMAHTVFLGGGVSLPWWRTRINATAAYSLRLQNASFATHTINPAISSPLLALPEPSLDGMVGTTLLNVSVTTRPLSRLTLSGRYRFYDYNDMTDDQLFPAHVVNDRTLVTEPRKAIRFGYTRHNADVDGRWRFSPALAALVGTGWEGWARNEQREVPHSNEYYFKTTADWSPTDWFLGRLTYRPSWRRIDQYDTSAHLEHHSLEDLTPGDLAQSQSRLLRKFDEGDRDRQAVQLSLQFVPIETLTTTVTGEWRYDDYVSSPKLGLQEATRWSAGVDVTWRPVEGFALFAGYVHELIYQRQRSRSRPVTGTTTFDFPDFDWITVNTDTVDTITLGTDITLIPRKLFWRTSATYAYALGEVDNRNPGPVTSGTPAQQATARAKPFPAFEDTWIRLDSSPLQYAFWKNWTARVGYAWESFQKNDWRTDRLNPWVPGVSSIWLGADQRNYSAHLLTVVLGYRFP